MTADQNRICERIRRVGFVRGSQVNLYGQVFELVSDPFVMGDDLVFVDGMEKSSGRLRRVRVPLPVVQMAKADVAKAA